MVFNKKQKDGVAKSLDNVWTAVCIAILAGTIVDPKLTPLSVTGLFAVGVVCLYGALYLRKGGRNDRN